MIDLKNKLKNEVGFTELNNNIFPNVKKGLIKNLFDDYSLALVPGNQKWKNVDEMHFVIYSPRFAKVMSCLFNDTKGKYSHASFGNKYLARKLRKDLAGVLGQSFAGVEVINGDASFFNGGIDIAYKDLLSFITEATTPEKLYEYMYLSKLNNFMIYVEDMWVFLYLCFEKNLNVDDILILLNNEEVISKVTECRLERDFDEAIIIEFQKCYSQI